MRCHPFTAALFGLTTALALTTLAPLSVSAAATVEKSTPCGYRAGVLEGRRDQPAQTGCGNDHDYLKGYSLGQRLHMLDRANENLRYDIHDVQDQLANRSRRGDASGLSLYLNRLHMRSAQIEARIRELEAQARKNGSGPLPNPQHELYYH